MPEPRCEPAPSGSHTYFYSRCPAGPLGSGQLGSPMGITVGETKSKYAFPFLTEKGVRGQDSKWQAIAAFGCTASSRWPAPPRRGPEQRGLTRRRAPRRASSTGAQQPLRLDRDRSGRRHRRSDRDRQAVTGGSPKRRAAISASGSQSQGRVGRARQCGHHGAGIGLRSDRLGWTAKLRCRSPRRRGQCPAIVTTGNSLPTFVLWGAEYCPYCAMMRWSMVAALSRFGTFTGLKVTSSAATDYNIPSFSFLGSHYTSKYLNFQSYEFEDRNQAPLQKLPSSAQALESKYGYPPFASTSAESGIPFMDINNKFVTSGDPGFMTPMIPFLQNGGPGTLAIGEAIHNPASTVGQAIQSKDFIIEANFIAATICAVDGAQPAAVCSSPMMQKTVAALNAVKTVS